jgi:hypothetical protein
MVQRETSPARGERGGDGASEPATGARDQGYAAAELQRQLPRGRIACSVPVRFEAGSARSRTPVQMSSSST